MYSKTFNDQYVKIVLKDLAELRLTEKHIRIADEVYAGGLWEMFGINAKCLKKLIENRIFVLNHHYFIDHTGKPRFLVRRVISELLWNVGLKVG